jgi:predicted MFS family arabinose efflux permease
MGGALADTVGWRTAFVLLGAIFAISGWQLRGAVHRSSAAQPAASSQQSAPSSPSAPAGTLARYAAVLQVPWARLILAVAAVEGLFAYGAIAFIPTSLHERTGVPIWLSGATMAAFGVGGLLYTSNAARLLRRFGETGLASGGGLLVAVGFLLIAMVPTASVGVFACTLLGLGFYMLHNTLQTHATQMAPSARGTGVALFAMSLFIGQSFGVTLAAQAVLRIGFVPVFASSAVGLLLIGSGFAWLLRRHRLLAPAGQ